MCVGEVNGGETEAATKTEGVKRQGEVTGEGARPTRLACHATPNVTQVTVLRHMWAL